jgi:hypothetical protein
MARKTCKDCIGDKYCSDYEKYDEAYISSLSDTEDVSTLCSCFTDKADVVPRSAYEQAQAEKDNLIATYEGCMRTYAEQLFGEIESLVAKYIDISIQTKSITSELNFEDMKTDLAELKKKHIGEK